MQIPYWQTAGAGFKRAASELHVAAEVAGPNNYDPKAEEREFIRVVKLKPAGILVSPADPDLMRPDIDAAIAVGIPVMTIDVGFRFSKRLSFIGTDNYEAGRTGGDWFRILIYWDPDFGHFCKSPDTSELTENALIVQMTDSSNFKRINWTSKSVSFTLAIWQPDQPS